LYEIIARRQNPSFDNPTRLCCCSIHSNIVKQAYGTVGWVASGKPPIVVDRDTFTQRARGHGIPGGGCQQKDETEALHGECCITWSRKEQFPNNSISHYLITSWIGMQMASIDSYMFAWRERGVGQRHGRQVSRFGQLRAAPPGRYPVTLSGDQFNLCAKNRRRQQ
jgi:hypothetical protein